MARKDADGADAARRNRLVKAAFGWAALLSILVGLALFLLSDRLGIDPTVARWIAIAFLISDLADYILLRNWDRIAGRYFK